MVKNVMTKKFFLSLAASVFLTAALAAQNQSAGVERYGLYIGSNNGGKNQERLLYAGTDAIAFQKIMTEIGGISKSNGILLLDPSKEDVDNAFEIISGLMQKNNKDAKRSEFVFYYSGHSDESSLILEKSKYDYSSLKASITNVPSDVHVVILDSCYSGNFIRTKGGSKQKPFLVDDSSVVKGHAYLSSSSSQEASQESDEIGSSFFTNAMINGLRGAADSSGDKKVTLNELYSYAFNETLSKTENTADPQHPNYNITLVGSGDLVLSDISAADCVLTISRELEGRVIVRDKNGKLVSEVNKSSLAPVYLALEEGQYGVTVIGERATLQGNFMLSPQKSYTLATANLSPIARAETRSRGDELEAQESAGQEAAQDFQPVEIPFIFSFVNNEIDKVPGETISARISLALIRSCLYEVNGPMFSLCGNETTILNGAQIGYIYNMARNVNGAQVAGIFNMSEKMTGGQAAGIFNLTQDLTGGQAAGIINFGQNIEGVQGAGIANIAQAITGIQGAGIANAAETVTGLQGAGIANAALGDVTGLQGAGIANAALGDVTGIQGAGITNFALGNVTGVQGSAIANVALGDIKGVQVGLFNFCKGNASFQLGLINYSRNGVFEFGVSYTTDEKVRLALNSGNKHLYTVLGAYINPNNHDAKTNTKNATAFFGLGSRIEVWKFNFDIEAMINEVFIVNMSEPDDKKKVTTMAYPSARVAVGFTPIKHLNIFAGFSMALETSENGKAFIGHKRNMVINAGSSTLYPEFDFGIKFSAN